MVRVLSLPGTIASVHLIRHGQQGPEVLDVQTRLARLGYPAAADERGTFGDATREAVRAFQAARGIGLDDIVGPVTWRELVDAGWALGDRLLYLRSPMLRGDDVRDLQDRLTTLGFDPGKTDGIFGVNTERALREFQHNYGLHEDAICGPAGLRALRGLPSMSGDTPIGPVREREHMLPRPGGVIGLRVFLDPGPSGEQASTGTTDETMTLAVLTLLEGVLAAAGSRVERSRALGVFPDDASRAQLANTLDADIVIAVRLDEDLRPNAAAVSSFGHARYRSPRGRIAAELVAERLLAAGVEAAPLLLRTAPLLRETRAPTIVIEFGSSPDPTVVAPAIADAVIAAADLGAVGATTRTP